MDKRRTYFLILLAVPSLLLSGCSGGSGEARNGRDKLIPAVEAVQAQQGSLPLIERLSGVVKAKNQVELFAEVSAIVKAVHVQNGDEVDRGQPLVSLRDTEFQERLKQAQAAYQIALAQARQAEARLTEAQSEFRRMQALAEKNLTSDAEFETAQTQAVSAEADVALARARVDQAAATVAEREEAVAQTVIRAPVAGTVGNRNAEVGMTVGPGSRLITLGQLDTVRVDIVLSDRMLTYIETGQRTEIRSASIPSGLLTSKLKRISPFLHPVTHSTEAEIELANPGHALKSGMFVTVDVYYGESERATLVPLSALYENPLTGSTGVYVCRDTLNRVPIEGVEVGKSSSLTEPVPFEFIPVDIVAKGRMSAGVAGVESGSWVITLGQDLLGGEPGDARVRAVNWNWVEHLQNLQREDLLDELVQKQQATGSDSGGI
ncbi:MAG: efflux RND transporter periplasmic adaptor subunit [Candidatus Zixiibacteriota bacterium]